jgi:hypothetical protein
MSYLAGFGVTEKNADEQVHKRSMARALVDGHCNALFAKSVSAFNRLLTASDEAVGACPINTSPLKEQLSRGQIKKYIERIETDDSYEEFGTGNLRLCNLLGLYGVAVAMLGHSLKSLDDNPGLVPDIVECNRIRDVLTTFAFIASELRLLACIGVNAAEGNPHQQDDESAPAGRSDEPYAAARDALQFSASDRATLNLIADLIEVYALTSCNLLGVEIRSSWMAGDRRNKKEGFHMRTKKMNIEAIAPPDGWREKMSQLRIVYNMGKEQDR